ncbi:restriction endonuclease subunit S [Parafannyhessea sp. LCP21S3_E6]|uniref:restriction endonuclease subunit S n=1 Tax=Parafannyhessea sp. LCP21S3_E6 TaxID=3438796 RepID=UPI003F963DEA
MTSKPPFGGEVVRLGDVCEVVGGATPKTSEPAYWDGGIKWVTPAEISDNTYILEDTAKHLTEAGFRSASLHMMPAGTVLLTTRAPIGKVALAGAEMCCNQGFKCLVCSDAVSNEWLYRYLKHRAPQLQTMGTGATFKELSKRAIANLEIVLPSLDDQLAAVHKLASVEQVMAILGQQFAKLDELAKSRFVEMFGTLEHPRYAIVELQDICAYIVDCPHETPKYDGMLEYPAIRTSELVGTTIDWSSMKYVSEEEYQRRTRRLIPQPGDIVYAREGTYGSAAILPDGYRFCLGQRTMLFRADASVCLPQYLLFAITSPDVKGQADLLNVGSTVPHVNVKDAKRFRIPLPSLALQREFADFAARVDKLRVEAQTQKEKLQMLYDSLAQDYFAI